MGCKTLKTIPEFSQNSTSAILQTQNLEPRAGHLNRDDPGLSPTISRHPAVVTRWHVFNHRHFQSYWSEMAIFSFHSLKNILKLSKLPWKCRQNASKYREMKLKDSACELCRQGCRDAVEVPYARYGWRMSCFWALDGAYTLTNMLGKRWWSFGAIFSLSFAFFLVEIEEERTDFV